MTVPTDQTTQPTFVDSERGLLIAVLVMVVLGAAAVLLMMG